MLSGMNNVRVDGGKRGEEREIKSMQAGSLCVAQPAFSDQLFDTLLLSLLEAVLSCCASFLLDVVFRRTLFSFAEEKTAGKKEKKKALFLFLLADPWV